MLTSRIIAAVTVIFMFITMYVMLLRIRELKDVARRLRNNCTYVESRVERLKTMLTNSRAEIRKLKQPFVTDLYLNDVLILSNCISHKHTVDTHGKTHLDIITTEGGVYLTTESGKIEFKNQPKENDNDDDLAEPTEIVDLSEYL